MFVSEWTVSAMMSKINMAAVMWGLCMDGLWRGWHFAMIGRHEEITRYLDEAYIRTYYHPKVMRVFCLQLKIWFSSKRHTVECNLIFT